MAKKDNTKYVHVHPVRLTEHQDAQVRRAAEAVGVTNQQFLRDALVKAGVVDQGPEQRTRAGYEKVEAAE